MNISRELKIGVAIVAAAVIFFFGIRFFAGMPVFGGNQTFYTSFESTEGLLPGAAVTINGVKVGAVSGVQLNLEEREARVEFSVDGDIPLPQGTRTDLTGLAYLGNLHLLLQLAPADRPPIESGSFIPSVGPEAGSDLFTSLSEGAPGLIAQTDTFVTTATQTMESLDRLLSRPQSDLRVTLAAARQAAVELRTLLENQRATLARTLTNFEAASQDVQQLVASSDDSLAQAAQRFNDASQRLNETLIVAERAATRLDGLLAALENSEGTLGLMLNDPSLYNHLDSAAVHLDSLLTDFQQRPGYYLEHLELVDIF